MLPKVCLFFDKILLMIVKAFFVVESSLKIASSKINSILLVPDAFHNKTKLQCLFFRNSLYLDINGIFVVECVTEGQRQIFERLK